MITSIPMLNQFFQIQAGYKVLNPHSGSIGTDPMSGCINRTLYNYNIYVQFDENDQPYFTVDSYIRHPWNSETAVTELQSKQFEFSEDGRMAIIDYLNTEAKAVIK